MYLLILLICLIYLIYLFLIRKNWNIIKYFFVKNFYFSNINLEYTKNTKNILLFSNSRVSFIKNYLDYGLPILKKFLKSYSYSEILIIGYAWPNKRGNNITKKFDDVFLNLVKPTFDKLNKKIKMLDMSLPKIEQQNEIKKAQVIVVLGGNTFWLLKALYDLELIDILKNKILTGTPYIGISAGTNIICPSINTTNDMPNVLTPSLNALNLLPFQINVHYYDHEEPSEYALESRDSRIEQYLEMFPKMNVIGLKSMTAIHVVGDNIKIVGFKNHSSVLLNFENNRLNKKVIPIGSDISYLLNKK